MMTVGNLSISYNLRGLKTKMGPVSGKCPVPPHLFREPLPFPDAVNNSNTQVLLIQEINVIGATLTKENFPFNAFPEFNVYLSPN